ncbi:MAG TPA: hypothetical protein VGK67_27365 [Myxococcales bacterium]|jgi:hypothetical protein
MRAALALAVCFALCLPAPARAQAMLKRTRLLDVTLRADEGGGGGPAPAASTSAPMASAEPRPVRRGIGWAFLPFGIGQYANGQPVKGTLLCVSEILLFATAAAALGIVESAKVENYGFMNGGKVQDEQMGDAMVMTYLIAFWTGVAVVGIGIADALVYRPSETTTVAVMPTAVAVKF